MGTPSISNKKRLLVALVCIAAIFLLLVGRIAFIQFFWWEDELKDMAESQWTHDTELTAQRGSIYDSNGVVLAQSGTAYRILLWPKLLEKKSVPERTRIATELAEVLDMDYATVYEKVNDITKSEIVLKRAVERSVVDELTERRITSGVVTAIDTKRYYPSGSLFSQLLGFTTVDGVGQSGIEQLYDSYLAGENGRMVTETDRKGNALPYGVQELVEAVDGYNIELTTDSVIQSSLEKALKTAMEVNNAKGAEGIVMNCKTGEILAASSQPDYDPNEPPRSDLEKLSDVSRNKIAADSYEPGSTFKVVTLCAALDSGTASLSDTFECPGYHIVNGEKIRCWKTGGHGTQDLTKAAENSCNKAFMSLALEMGAETFYDYIYSFGFGASTGSGIPGESSGIVTHEKYVNDNTLARIGFGQSIAVTPIQLATAVCAAVNGGNLMQPYVVNRITTQSGEVILDNEPTVVRRVISEETSKTVRDILESVVANGSGKNAAIPGYRVGGKTGTAQKYENGVIADGKLIASFVGFAPADDPQYVCLILVDEPQVGTVFGSTVAAPWVKQVLEETLHHGGILPEVSAKTVTVGDFTGMDMADAVAEIEGLGLIAVHQEDDAVVAQAPMAGEVVKEGTEILLYTAATGELSTEEEHKTDLVTVPSVLGLTRLKAHDALKELGLMMINPVGQVGTAIRQVPAAGEKVPVGTEVLVEFAKNNITN